MVQNTEPEAIQQIKSTLEPYIKPREQVSYIRRVLALHLQRQRQTDTLQRPLSLLQASDQVQHHRETHGLQRDYLRAVRANIKARQEHAQLSETSLSDTAPVKHQQSSADHLREHLALIKLQQKHERLAAIQKHLDTLTQQPVASPDFLNLEEIYNDSIELPQVPREVVNSFGTDTTAAKADLAAVVNEMEKVVLRTKILLRQEEKLLNVVRDRVEPGKDAIGEMARLHALNVTRNELINWIETELSKATGDDADQDTLGEPPNNGVEAGSADVDLSQQLAQVKEKYASYVATRKSLLTLASQRTRPIIKLSQTSETPRVEEAEDLPSSAGHIMLPYLEDLLDLSRQQKGMIQQKSHINNILAQQVKDTRQILVHLAEESQLLPSHSMPAAKRGKLGFDEHMSAAASDTPDTVSQVRPWVYAADSAKISTMETVAEKVEEGHLALEGSMKALHDVEQLFGRKRNEHDRVITGDTTEDDIWLTEEPSRKAGARQHPDAATFKWGNRANPWAVLDGKLGLMG
ncbi:hypothetical protein VD0002_g2018 [Verticillium dahliae]|uniref:Uncharacterized protein n=3 Tax=Verticillium TaxID=1036719 RepID=G2X2Z8_VERDV|nr:uncharacterized protein VDAG_04193 [Verticillium dahliae VdLs.17]KAF3346414.1 Vacuolar protein-sorting-associated protein 25 [Verticillium dahliae VDG2]KAH6700461.1 hypothetical protein EV126DRAFT_35853 [Verticillium dahliae]EGY22755.1 hypothetical protein VDAG_04193 [Verticillium dahliae VdLs.17]PNH34531.1 hypothetical protein BJF96_g2068 [Verticillium dahliae]PNH53802.1 hypothetical protein VD0003_g3653 [Verticillium dahliae]